MAYLFSSKSVTTHSREVLETPIFFTICLLSSSLTIHLASKELENGHRKSFLILWAITIALGALFLFGTGLNGTG